MLYLISFGIYLIYFYSHFRIPSFSKVVNIPNQNVKFYSRASIHYDNFLRKKSSNKKENLVRNNPRSVTSRKLYRSVTYVNSHRHRKHYMDDYLQAEQNNEQDKEKANPEIQNEMEVVTVSNQPETKYMDTEVSNYMENKTNTGMQNVEETQCNILDVQMQQLAEEETQEEGIQKEEIQEEIKEELQWEELGKEIYQQLQILQKEDEQKLKQEKTQPHMNINMQIQEKEMEIKKEQQQELKEEKEQMEIQNMDVEQGLIDKNTEHTEQIEELDYLEEKEEDIQTDKTANTNTNDDLFEYSESELEEFTATINARNICNEQFDNKKIRRFIKIGSYLEDKVKTKEKYPIYQGKKIDFSNIRKPFGTTIEAADETKIKSPYYELYFDDICHFHIKEFLTETYIGNLNLRQIIRLYKYYNVHYVPFSVEVLQYLEENSYMKNVIQQMEYYLQKFVLYSQQNCRFHKLNVDSISEQKENSTNIINRLMIISKFRQLAPDEKNQIQEIYKITQRSINILSNALNNGEYKREELLNILINFSNKLSPDISKFETRERLIITAMHYLYSYLLLCILPYYKKILSRNFDIARDSGKIPRNINYLIDLLEFLQHNSKLYNDFVQKVKIMDRVCPRLYSLKSIVSLYKYITLNLEIISVIFNFYKIHIRVTTCFKSQMFFQNMYFPIYERLISELQLVCQAAIDLMNKP